MTDHKTLVARLRAIHRNITVSDGGEGEVMAMVRKAAARIEALEAERAWRPIETAPKDGTRILLWLADEDFAVTAIWKQVPDEDWRGWWLLESDEYEDDDTCHAITHWMPMPEPPAPGDGHE